MGHSPPIPVDPIQSVPETVLRHTPGQVHGALAPSNPIEQNQPQQAPAPSMQYPVQNQQPTQMPSQQVPTSNGFPSNHMRPPTTQGQPTSYFPDQSMQQTNTGHTQQPGTQQYPHGFGQPIHGQPIHAMTGQMSQNGLPGQNQSQGNGMANYGQPMQQPTMQQMGQQQQSRQEDPTHRSDRPRTKTVPPPSAAQTRKDGHRRAQSLSVPAQSPDPGSFLDRVENDPKLQSMLSGAPTRTVHTSGPVTGSSIHTHTDKPLPDPRSRSKRTVSRRQSLMGDLNHHPSTGHINSGDRYPSFPVNGNGHARGHSRQSSFIATRTGGPNDL